MNTNLKASVEKIIEIRDKRTHCQCSRAKVVEKIAFDRAIKAVSDCETVQEAIEKLSSVQFDRKTKDTNTFQIAYSYCIQVLKHYE